MPRVLSASDFEKFRSRVCTAAMELLSEQGFDGLNMRKLAERLDVSAMTAYRYFHSKADIVAAVRSRELEGLADRLETAAHAREESVESFAAVCRAYVEFAREDPARYRLMFDLAQSLRTDELISAEQRIHEAFMSSGRLSGRSVVGDIGFARLAWASLHGIMTLTCLHSLEPSELDDLLTETIRSLAGAGRPNGRSDHRAPNLEHFPRRGANTDAIPLTAAE